MKEVAEMMRGEGFNAVLVVPVRLPLARVAMLGFAGPQVLEEAEEIAALAGPQLMLAGDARSRRALALAVTIQVRSCRKHANYSGC